MELLTKAERLTQEQSRSREKVISLNKKADTEAGVTEEERSELSTHVDRLESIEPEIRAATTGRGCRARPDRGRGPQGRAGRWRDPRGA